MIENHLNSVKRISLLFGVRFEIEPMRINASILL